MGTEYKVLMTEKRTDINGTGYTEFGEYILKYSPDGVTCVSGSGSVLWNSTFSMQSPIVDVRGTTAVIADQKGTQIYVFNQNGQQGQFQTSLPVEKVRVAKQGVVAAVLNDDDITWVNFYDAQGEEIAKSRNSLGDSGYPLDIALSPDGMKIMVSYLCITKGIMNTKICFYNFDSVGQAEINNMVASQIYENAVAPEVIFTDEGTSVAFLSNGFSIFKGKQIPEETKKVQFEEEILSIFHDLLICNYYLIKSTLFLVYNTPFILLSLKKLLLTLISMTSGVIILVGYFPSYLEGAIDIPYVFGTQNFISKCLFYFIS